MRVLDTERLRLLPWEAEHTELLIAWSAIPAVVRHVSDGRPWTRERAEDRGRRQVEHWARHDFGWRVAVERGTGDAVGLIALSFAGEGTPGVGPDEHEIGWWLHPDAWGRGLAREGAAAVRDDAMGRLAAPSVVARIQPANAASIAVATALGLRHEADSTGPAGEALGIYRLTASAKAGPPGRSPAA